MRRGLGLVKDVFSPKNIKPLIGNIGIAHTRYGTSGGYSESEVQPLILKRPFPIALVHNGNLINYIDILNELKQEKRNILRNTLDSAVLLQYFAMALQKINKKMNEKVFFESVVQAIKTLYEKLEGAYSVIAVMHGYGLVAFRDPHGIRPLVWGERKARYHHDYIFSSENTAFYSLGFQLKGDLKPGEVVFVSKKGKMYRQCITQNTFTPCAFEYVYFARPDATLDKVSVYRARLRMGQNLAKAWIKKFPKARPDVVIPAPFTANTAALSFAHELGVRYSEGLYKNPFIGRTFIMPNQEIRERNVKHKLTPQLTEIKNKKVLIVDDSIVRGTTSREIVRMVRDAGAAEINFVSTCPPLRSPCFYGIDIPSRKELIAANRSIEGIKKYLGVDRLLYQTEDDLVEAITRKNPAFRKPCLACMNGCYVSGHLTKETMSRLEKTRKRNDD